MPILVSVLLFALGFFILIKGADFIIKGATTVARFLGVSQWLIGVVIVGIGTSLPELAINIQGAFDGNTIGVGTIIGSNLFNMLAILGVMAFATPLVFRESWIRIDMPINIFVIILSGLVLFFPVFGGTFFGITTAEAVLLFVVFIIWIYFMAKRKDDDIVQPHSEHADTAAWYISALLIIVGIGGVFLGSEWIVGGAERIALFAGISEGLISLTIVALGTSVPEIAVSLRALMKRNTTLAVGNVIGSNIFDLIGIFGITGIITAIPVSKELSFDYTYLLVASSLLFILMFLGKKKAISRGQGLFLFLTYVVYLLIIIIRG